MEARMPMPKRIRLKRIQVWYRQPNRFEQATLGQSYTQIRWSAHLDEGDDGELIVRLTSRTQPTRGDVLQAVICLMVRRWPNATISDLMDLAGCSRETAHRRKQLALQINAAYDARSAVMQAASGSVARRSS